MQFAPTHENKNPAFAKEISQRQRGGDMTFQFVDDRPGTAQIQNLQKAADNSSLAKQTAQMREMATHSTPSTNYSIQKKNNNTGLPDNLKSGIENLSGYSMDDVKVHLNSAKPAQLQAHAYAQGTEIHVAPGQEKHLAHEAWHVVQQKQGRVKPTIQMKQGIPVNDDSGLEKEADVMGAKALSANTATDSENLTIGGNPTIGTTQLQPVLGKVIWGVTHVAKEVNGSIYGDGKKYSDGEIGWFGELEFGEVILVDDDDLFMSRRGANQENQGRRNDDGQGVPLVEWTRVLKLKGVDVRGLNVYVRSETFSTEDVVDKEARFEKPVIDDVEWDDAVMLAGVKAIGDEYETIVRERGEKKPPRNICSTPHMDQDDEGFDVAREFEENPGYRNLDEYAHGGFTKKATRGETLIGVMQITIDEEFASEERPKPKYLYVKWLLGSRSKKGSGTALIRSAIEYAIENNIKTIKVESAMSAVSWYEKQGFVEKGRAQHMNDYNDDVAEADGNEDLPRPPEEEVIDCGCVEMELNFFWSEDQL